MFHTRCILQNMSTHASVRFRLAINDHRNNSELPAFCHSGKFILFLKLKYSVFRPNGARPTEAGRPAGRLTVMRVRHLLVRNSRRRRKARPGIVRTASNERARPGPATLMAKCVGRLSAWAIFLQRKTN